MAPPRHPLRSYIVALFRRGELVSVHEATLICDASRQAITKWLKAEGISAEAHRLAYLAKLRTNGQRQIEGRPPLQKPSKAQQRRALEKAIERFNRANAKSSAQMAGSGRTGASRPPGSCAPPQVE
jgi:hypothetical protein